jgi:LuxR family maltose regulon positive regulatory protein
MAARLLTTKLYIPPPPRNLVARVRLLQQLDEGLDLGCSLTLVSAPAGCGKTSLLSAWVRGSQRSVAWVSLDQGDEDPTRFLAYVLAALQQVPELEEAGIEAAVQPTLLRPGGAGDARWDPRLAMTSLINEIAAANPEPFLLVLDNYQTVNEPRVHAALAFLLDNIPPQMHLVIASRADPPLPIARLRIQGRLTELRERDLRFTLEEAMQLLAQHGSTSLAKDDLAKLVERTEGWAAGIHVAALSLRDRDDAAGFVAAFEGSQRHILDYLVEEVVSRESPEVQTFLLRTSILDQMSAPLCSAVIGDDDSCRIDSRQLLRYLERAGLFVFPLDERGEWYRYHHLFADLLRLRLLQLHPQLIAGIHTRAAEWYERQGLTAEAIGHAISGKSYERAADLVEQAAQTVLMRSEIATFIGWVERLPPDVVRSRVRLSLYYGAALLWSGRPMHIVESHLPKIAPDESVESFPGDVAAVCSLIAALQGNPQRCLQLAEHAMRELPEDSVFLRSIAAGSLNIAHIMKGDFDNAIRSLEQAVRLSRRTGNVMGAVGAMSNLAGLCLVRGELDRALDIYQRAMAVAVDGRGRQLPVAGKVLLGLGEVARELGDLDAAARHLEQGIELLGQYVEIGNVVGYASLALVEQARGKAELADAIIQKARQMAVEFDAADMDDVLVDIAQARILLDRGDVRAAARILDSRNLADSDAMMQELHTSWQSTRARLHIAQGRADDALAIIEPLLASTRQPARRRRTVEILSLQAAALHVRGDSDAALAVLREALELGEPAGFLRTIVDVGEAMQSLLQDAVSQGISPEYTARLLAAFQPRSAAPHARPAQPLIEPLSGRELEVLDCLAEGLTNREIGQRLHISLPTVKSHTRSIYGKLGVHSRKEAAARAEALGILPP